MINNFKPRFVNLKRERVSLNRDFEKGLRLDRNEKVDDYEPCIFEEVVKSFLPSDLSAYPETDWFYEKLSLYLGVDKNNIFLTQGSDGAIKHIFETLCFKGQKVVTPTPTFAMYEVYSKMHETIFVEISYDKNKFELKLDELCNNITDGVGVVFLPNPNQPIDSLIDLDALRDIANKCLEKNIYLVVDEAYFVFSDQSAMQLIYEFENVLILRTFSKAFGLAGARLGYIVSNEKLISYLEKGRLMVEANMLSLRTAAYFLDNYHYVLDYVKAVKESQKSIHDSLKPIGINSYGHNGNFVFIDLLSQDRRDAMISLLRQHSIYVRGGFREPWNSFIRVSVGKMDKMGIFIEKFKECLNELK